MTPSYLELAWQPRSRLIQLGAGEVACDCKTHCYAAATSSRQALGGLSQDWAQAVLLCLAETAQSSLCDVRACA